jgi:hypothetical protein
MGKTVAVAASGKRKPKPKRKPGKTTVVKVASGAYSEATGQQTNVELTLSSTGKRLLNQFYRLPATVVIGGTTPITRTVTFSFGRISSPVNFTWAFNAQYSIAQQLTISGLPPKPKVSVICHGGGCPFAKKTFSPHGKKLALAPTLKNRRLAPHTTLELEITSSNHVGKVLIFTIRSAQPPSLAERCLPPGSKRPTACA